MASEMSDYMVGQMLGWIKGTATATAPTNVYVALFNGDPTPAGTGGSEVTVTIRPAGRLAVSLGAITSRAILNDAAVDFGLADAGATITHAALFDAASAGNMISSSPLDTTRIIAVADPVVVPIGNLNVNFN